MRPAPARAGGGSAPGMAEPERDPEQIRLKCVRKEGFFAVPPEHRVRRGAARRRRGGGGTAWGPEGRNSRRRRPGPRAGTGVRVRGGSRRLSIAGLLGRSRFRAPTQAFLSSAPGTGFAGRPRIACVGGQFTRGQRRRRDLQLGFGCTGLWPPVTRHRVCALLWAGRLRVLLSCSFLSDLLLRCHFCPPCRDEEGEAQGH